jgi:hypothetical protein
MALTAVAIAVTCSAQFGMDVLQSMVRHKTLPGEPELGGPIPGCVLWPWLVDRGDGKASG